MFRDFAVLNRALYCMLCIALASAPCAAQRSLPLGVTRLGAPEGDVATYQSRTPPDTVYSNGNHVILGAYLGALTGVAVTVAVIRECQIHEPKTVDGPVCPMAVVTVGVPAVVVGAFLGGVLGSRWPKTIDVAP